MKNNLCSLSHLKKIVTALLLLLVLGPLQAQTVSTYNYTGAVQSFTATASGLVTINCKGAKGADGIPGYGGAVAGTGALGGTVEGTYPVAGGQVLYIWVGGAASGSTGGVNGGGNGNHSSGAGGGASDIRLGDVALGSRILVAGGGGGGGNGGSIASNLPGGNGGVGGGGAGTNGANSTGGGGGEGASGATGGAHGDGCSFAYGTSGGNGVAGIGGAGGTGLALTPSNIYSSGGGGGGGYVGGGGGGAGSAGTYSCTLNETGAGGGGAGGSNYIASGFTSTTSTTGTGPSGNGAVVITFTAVDPITGTLSVCAGSTTSLSNATTGGTWSSGDVAKATINSSGVVSGVAAGTATISYLTPAGATATEVVTVNPLAVSTGTYTAVSCNGGSNGRASVSYSGGTSPYTFSWAPSGGTASLATGLAANSYTCTITDGKACVTTQTVTVTQPSAISTVGSYTATSCNGGSNGKASVSVGGGTPSYFYSWAPSGGTGSTATGLTAGNYTVTVTDNNSCTRTQTVTVTQPTSVGTATAVTNVACNGGNNGVAAILGSGGTPPYTYLWAPGGAITSAITGLTAGSYTATVTDANGCTATKRATVTQPSALSATTVVTNATCGNNDGAIDLTVSGGAGGYTYLWNGGATTQDRTGLAAGTHTVVITDANNCTFTLTPTVGGTVITGTTVVTDVSCNGGNNGSIDLTPTGGTAPYTYSWSGGAITEDRSGLAAGTYTVSITDAGSSCTGTVTATVGQPAAALSSIGSYTATSCNGGSNGRASVSVSGGTPGYSYSWAPSGGTASLATGLAAGNYTCTITDNKSCIATQTVTVTQPSALSAVGSYTTVSCNGGNNGSASVSVSGGTPSYFYSWAPSGGTGATATGLSAGNYTVTITDNNSCAITQTVTVTQPSALSSSVGSYTNIACNGGSTGAATILASGGTPAYTYSWTPTGGTAASMTGRPAGSYTCTITDANNCAQTLTVTLTQPSAVGTSTGTTTALCNGGLGSASVVATGGVSPYSFDIAPGTFTSTPISSGMGWAGLPAGSYTMTVTDANSCVKTRVVNVTQPAVITTSVTTTDVSCNGGANGSATVSASGGVGSFSYSWAPSGGTAATVNGLAAGNYTCTVTDANSCVKTQTVTVTQPSAISAVGSYTAVSCNGGSNGRASVSVSGGTPSYTYSWAPSGGTASLATGMATGNYTVTVTDANNCTQTQTVTVTQPSAITTSTVVTNVSCNGGTNGSATITASGGTGDYSYSWAPSGGTAATATGLAAGTYTCTITDANSCTETQEVTITQPSAITTNTVSVTTVSCNGGTNGAATITASGGTGAYSYSWAPSAGTAATATGLAAGIYTCTVTDANSCTQTQEVTITQPSAITSSISLQTDVSCNGGANGSAMISASGGTGSYTYSWAPSGGTAATATGLAAGSYTCTITDANSCTKTQEVTITQPTAVSISSISSNGPVCSGATLSLSGTASGGVGSFTYTWDGPNSFSSIAQDPFITSATTAATGVYTFTATDANNCVATGTVSVTVNPTPDAGTITGTASVCEASTTTLSNTSGIGTGTWSTDATGAASIDASGVVSGLVAGTTTITYTATTVCGTATTTQVVTVNPLPVAGTITGTASVCEASTTTLTDASAGGTWMSDALGIATVNSLGVVSGVATGTATITYTVTNGCGVATTTQIVTVNPLPYAGGITGATNVCMSIPATLTNAISGGTWATGDASVAAVSSTGVVSGVSGGTATISYSVTNGCGTDIATHVVNVVPLPTAGAITGTASVCPSTTTTLGNAVTGGVWSDGASTIATINSTGIVSGITAGTATITYMVSNVCGSAMATKIVTVNALPDAGTITGAASVCQNSTITLSDAVSGGMWTMNVAGIVHVTSSGLVLGVTAGTATVTYTVNNACGTDYTTKNITVNPLPNAGSISGTASLNVGSTTTLSNTTTGGTWSTGAATVATVNASGVVTGVSAGTAVISYTVTNGCSASATTIVTVYPVTLGTTTAAANVNISLYPNPTSGTFAVTTPEAGNLSIYTLEGREVMNTTVNAGTTNISLSPSMATGIYMCRFTGNNGAQTIVRMVYEH